MKTRTLFFTLVLAAIGFVGVLNSRPLLASDIDDLAAMLREFLSASDSEAAHAAFWAEDLVYTSSAGSRFGKADIMAGFERTDTDEKPSDAGLAMNYSGDNVDIRVYGDTAIVAFRLLASQAQSSDELDVQYYFNTGTFLKREGVWRVVAWQATKIPAP